MKATKLVLSAAMLLIAMSLPGMVYGRVFSMDMPDHPLEGVPIIAVVMETQTQVSHSAGALVRMNCAVEAVLRGPIKAKQVTITMTFQERPSGSAGSKRNYATMTSKPMMVFLKPNTDGTYSPVGPDYSWFRVRANYRLPRGGGQRAIEDLLVAGLRSGELEVIDDSIRLLAALNDRRCRELVEAEMRQRKATPPMPYRVRAMEYGMAHPNAATIEAAVRLFKETKPKELDRRQHLSVEDARAYQQRDMEREWNWRVRSAFMRMGTPGAGGVAALHKVLLAEPEIRGDALTSARTWADHTSIPVLMKVLPKVEGSEATMCQWTLAHLTGRSDLPNRKAWLQWWHDRGGK
jgi:hypothetical protein